MSRRVPENELYNSIDAALSYAPMQCANVRPWVRRFVEEYGDGRPWGYALFEDPTIDEEVYEDYWCRIDNLLNAAQNAVYSRNRAEFPRFEWETLDWPEDEEQDSKGQQQDSNDKDEEHGADVSERSGDEVSDGREDTVGAMEEEDDDADFETVRELPKLRAHFKWVRDRARKRRISNDPPNVDLSGIPQGLHRDSFLVIDQDVIDSARTGFPRADSAWIWAIDPDYTGNVNDMTRNGLKDEYYGYMRVRVQQLVNNFWEARHYRQRPLPMVWEAAKQSHRCAFVSEDAEEARMISNDVVFGSALGATTRM